MFVTPTQTQTSKVDVAYLMKFLLNDVIVQVYLNVLNSKSYPILDVVLHSMLLEKEQPNFFQF